MTSRSSPERSDDEGIRRVVTLAVDVLGTAVVGIYLHGSAVLGGLKPTSDLDVLAVVNRATTEDERRLLVARLLDISGRRARLGPARPVELTIVKASEMKPWIYPPQQEFMYGEWLRDDYSRGFVPSPGPSPDLAPLVAMTLAGTRALVGPPPAEVFDPVPAADLRAAIVDGIPGLMADLESDTRNVLLTLARIWHTTATGEISSKDEAAAWAGERLHGRDRQILLLARDQYVAGTHGEWETRLRDARATAEAIMERKAGTC